MCSVFFFPKLLKWEKRVKCRRYRRFPSLCVALPVSAPIYNAPVGCSMALALVKKTTGTFWWKLCKYRAAIVYRSCRGDGCLIWMLFKKLPRCLLLREFESGKLAGDASRKKLFCIFHFVDAHFETRALNSQLSHFPLSRSRWTINFVAPTGTHPLSGLVVKRTCDVDGTCHVLHREGATYVTAGDLVPNSRGWKLKQRAR